MTPAEQVYRVAFYVLAFVAAVSAGFDQPGIAVWCGIMSAVAFGRGKLWIEG